MIRSRGQAAAVAVAVAGMAALLPACRRGPTVATAHGDAGGRILAALRPVNAAVPADAMEVSSSEHESAYSTKCPDNPSGRPGWSAVAVVTTFRSEHQPSLVISDIGRRLAPQGWQPTRAPWDRQAWQLQPEAEWAKTLPNGQSAIAVIYQYPAGFGGVAGSWFLGAQAKPPGYASPGC